MSNKDTVSRCRGHRNRLRGLRVALLIFTLAFTAGMTPAVAQERVAILPFDLNAPPEFAYLKNGIADMLATRLAIPDKTVVIDRQKVAEQLAAAQGPLTVEKAVAAGKALQADYVLLGSLTLFGESVSTDARFVEVDNQSPRVVFSRTGDSHGALIGHMDELADAIKADVFGMQTAVARQAPPSAGAPSYQQHPERMAGGVGIIRQDQGPPPVLAGRSRRIREQVQGVGAGDIDGDGWQEVVIISTNTVEVYKLVEGIFQRSAKFEESGFPQYIAVDAADINANGLAEIFVTALDNGGNNLQSFVLEWREGSLVKIAEDARYFRVIDIPQRGKVLLGQTRAIYSIFQGGVEELTWSGGKYIPVQPLNLPGSMNLFSFAFGEAFNDGRTLIVAYDGDDYLRVTDEAGNVLWKSLDKMGGNAVYLQHPAADPLNTAREAGMSRGQTYLPQRLAVADLDGDGKNEILTADNEDSLNRLFKRIRVFKRGALQTLSWNGSVLLPQWKTVDFQNYISDFALADLDNDGLLEIVFAVVAEQGTIATEAKSSIYTVDLNQAPPETEQPAARQP